MVGCSFTLNANPTGQAKPRKKENMFKDKTRRRGLALGAILGLVAGLFGGILPAQAVSNTAIVMTAAGDDPNTFATFVDDDFTLLVTRDATQISEADFKAFLHYEITSTRTYNSTYSITVDTSTESGTGVHAVVKDAPELFQEIYYNGSLITEGTAAQRTSVIPSTESGTVLAAYPYVVSPQDSASAIQKISFRLGAGHGLSLSSSSPGVDVLVRPFLDLNGNSIYDSASEPSGAVKTVSFKKYSDVSPTVAISSVEAGTSHLTASATIAGVNVGQLPGKFAVRFTAWQTSLKEGISYSAIAEQQPTFTKGYSLSDTVTLGTAAAVGNTFSAQVVYSSVSPFTVLDTDGATELALTKWPLATTTVAAAGATAQSMYAQKGDNAVLDSGSDYDVRANSLVTVVASYSGVLSTSAVTATWRFTGVTLDDTKHLSVNGGAAQKTATHSAVTSTVNAVTGLTSITVLPTGFDLTDTLTVHVDIPGQAEQSITLDAVAASYTLTRDASDVATSPNTAVSVGATVKDQWGVKSARTDQRLKFTWTSGYSGTATVSTEALVAGYAKKSVIPSRTPSTGSGVVSIQLQYLNGDVWTDQGSAVETTVTVTDAANGFRTGLAASYSASISYGAAFSWSADIDAAYAVVTGSQVVVSGAGLIFKDSAGDTASDTITLPGNSTGQVTFAVTARKAGTYTVTLTAGSSSTTSLIVVNPARSDMGSQITWDTTTIQPGKSRIVTGTLTDANGNPVDTTGPGQNPGGSTASIVVTYAGSAGVPVGSMPTETDADGKFRISVLTLAADSGAFTLTATYLKDGASTATAHKVTSVQTVTVGTSAADSADQKITVGTFKGYVAIYTKGYMGQKLSAKVAGKWLVVDPITAYKSNDYSRVVRLTGAGYSIVVDLYIDGAFVRSETVTTK